jgi:hypothetical protein
MDALPLGSIKPYKMPHRGTVHRPRLDLVGDRWLEWEQRLAQVRPTVWAQPINHERSACPNQQEDNGPEGYQFSD